MRFGIIGFGRIARKFAKSIEYTTEGTITAIASKSVKSDDDYLKNHPSVKVYSDYLEMLQSGEIDAVYIAIPHAYHKEWIIKALENKVAVLSEKPMVLTEKDVCEIQEKVKETQTYCLEALKTRFNVGLQHLKEDLHHIGKILSIEANFCFDGTPLKESSYLFEKGQGGAINDVGCYLVGFVFTLIGSNVKKVMPYVEKEDGIDLYFKSDILFEDDIHVILEGAVDRNKERYALIKGEQGEIKVPMFNRVIHYTITKNNGEVMEKEYPIHGDDMTMEIQAIIDDVKAGKIESDVHPLEDARKITALLELMRG